MDPAARLDELRECAAAEGVEWLRSKVQGVDQDEVQSLAAAAGLKVREGGDKVGLKRLREMLLKKLAAEVAGPEVA